MTLETVLPLTQRWLGATELSVRRVLSPTIYCELFCKTDQKNEGKESRVGKGGRASLRHCGYLYLHREGKGSGKTQSYLWETVGLHLLEILSCKRNGGGGIGPRATKDWSDSLTPMWSKRYSTSLHRMKAQQIKEIVWRYFGALCSSLHHVLSLKRKCFANID